MRITRFAVVALAILLASAPAVFCGEAPQEDKDKAAIAALRAKLEKPVAVDMVDMTVARALDLLAKRAAMAALSLSS